MAVVSALEYAGKSAGGGHRPSAYFVVVKLLEKKCSPSDKIAVDVKLHLFTLLHTLINANDDLGKRVRARQQLMDTVDSLRIDLPVLLGQLRQLRNSNLDAQIDAFDTLALQDKRQAQRKGVDLSDIDSVFQFLKTSAAEDGFSAQLLSVLQLLVTIPSEEVFGGRIWNNVQYIVHMATISSRKDDDGTEQDPADSYLTYEDLANLLIEKEDKDVIQHENEIKRLEDQLENQRKELHKVRFCVDQLALVALTFARSS